MHMQTSTPNTRHDYTKRLWDCVSAAFWDCALLGPARSCWSLHLLLVLRLLLCACPALTVLLLAPRIHPVVILCTNPFFPCSARLARQGSNSIDERHDKVHIPVRGSLHAHRSSSYSSRRPRPSLSPVMPFSSALPPSRCTCAAQPAALAYPLYSPSPKPRCYVLNVVVWNQDIFAVLDQAHCAVLP